MIINCFNCLKKFEVEDNLIPKKGRSVQCSSCKNIWFFKKNTEETLSDQQNLDFSFNIKKEINIKKENTENLDTQTSVIDNRTQEKKTLNQSNIFYKITSYLIVMIISLVGLVIVLDTFKISLSNIFPNLEITLFSLYETFSDIGLFLKDLIK